MEYQVPQFIEVESKIVLKKHLGLYFIDIIDLNINTFASIFYEYYNKKSISICLNTFLIIFNKDREKRSRTPGIFSREPWKMETLASVSPRLGKLWRGPLSATGSRNHTPATPPYQRTLVTIRGIIL